MKYIFLLSIIMLAPIYTRAAPPAKWVNATADMQFNDVEYTGIPTGDVVIATNNTITYGSGFSGTGTGTAGEAALSGRDRVVDLSCATTATLASGANTITLKDIEFVVGTTNVTSAGNGFACLGLGITSTTYTITNILSENTLSIGGALEGAGATLVSEPYATNTGSGVPMTFELIVQ